MKKSVKIGFNKCPIIGNGINPKNFILTKKLINQSIILRHTIRIIQSGQTAGRKKKNSQIKRIAMWKETLIRKKKTPTPATIST